MFELLAQVPLGADEVVKQATSSGWTSGLLAFIVIVQTMLMAWLMRYFIQEKSEVQKRLIAVEEARYKDESKDKDTLRKDSERLSAIIAENTSIMDHVGRAIDSWRRKLLPCAMTAEQLEQYAPIVKAREAREAKRCVETNQT